MTNTRNYLALFIPLAGVALCVALAACTTPPAAAPTPAPSAAPVVATVPCATPSPTATTLPAVYSTTPPAAPLAWCVTVQRALDAAYALGYTTAEDQLNDYYEGYTFALSVPCPTEDSDNCYWNATTRGNGVGGSFVNIAGAIYPIK